MCRMTYLILTNFMSFCFLKWYYYDDNSQRSKILVLYFWALLHTRCPTPRPVAISIRTNRGDPHFYTFSPRIK